MKKKTATLLTALFAAAGVSAFGQGYMDFGSGTAEVWDEFTSPGVGAKPAVNTVDVALLWATTGALDPLSNVGGNSVPNQSNSGGGGVNDQVATNAVLSAGVQSSANAIASLLADGWQVGTLNGSSTIIDETISGSKGQIQELGGAELQVGGASGTVQMIVVAWEGGAGGGAAALSDLTTNALTGELGLGWSNPLTYTLGTSSTDANGAHTMDSTSTQSPVGINLNQFGVAPTIVPEPATLALAGLGGLSLLLFRRRK